jgi:hypothetical protein
MGLENPSFLPSTFKGLKNGCSHKLLVNVRFVRLVGPYSIDWEWSRERQFIM